MYKNNDVQKDNCIPYIILAVLLTVAFLVAIHLQYGTFSKLLTLVISDLNLRTPQTVQTLTEPKSAFAAQLAQPLYTKPVKLRIDTVNIDLDLQTVGTDPNGKLETPTNFASGGWYKRGAKPGESGNMIINAHYDNVGGIPAAFWELKNVNVNDTVTLVDRLGRIYTYKVTDIFFVDIQDPTRLEILSDTNDKSELTLITCGGVWSTGANTYQDRLVVKGELVT